ncbi:electron transfer flavoprotein subunit beta/FixA family protein [Dendrosporobacter sp. 1207_IL3150]|uniref:electron transfer flavoprotein subunit beta/FixA family protein n=1 Tax=Dendrosporobacter sp. 1207_IL3150 TaxID=3084054 RepID=UPI002FD91E34
MNICVCVKQVPDTLDIRLDPTTNTLIRQGVASIINPHDKHALEAALQLKEQYGGNITVISMGPLQAKEILKDCLAMGADKAILVSDTAFVGSDTLATSYTLAYAIKKAGNFDIIICGSQSSDGDTAQVGPQLAEQLGIAQITWACSIKYDGAAFKVTRETEMGFEVIEAKLPLLVSVLKNMNIPRYPSVSNTIKAHRANITVWTADDINISCKKVGIKGSPTRVTRIFTPERKGKNLIIQKESAQEAVELLLRKLTEERIF